MTISLENIPSAIAAANAAPYTVQRASGCGRAYCVISIPRKLQDGKRNPDRLRTLKAIEKACKSHGLMYLSEAYGIGRTPAIYIGYDNGTGRELGRSVAFTEELLRHGIQCYADAVGD